MSSPNTQTTQDTLISSHKFKYNIGDILKVIKDGSFYVASEFGGKHYKDNLRVVFRFYDGNNNNVYVVECEDNFAFILCEKEADLVKHSTAPNTPPDNKPVKSRQLDEKTYQALKRLGFLDTSVRSYNQGKSDYSRHIIQPWSIWQEYNLNPWDADIVKRILRTKQGDSRRLDYEKIIHICEERIRQIECEAENPQHKL